MILQRIICFLVALSFAVNFFGVAMNGIVLALAFLTSIGLLINYRQQMMRELITLKSSSLVFFFGLIVLVCAVSSWNSYNPSASFEKLIELCFLCLSGFIIYMALRINDFDFQAFFKVAVIGCAVFSFYLILTPFLGEYAWAWRNLYSSVIVLVVPFACLLIFQSTSKNLIFWCLLFAIIIAAIFATGGRTAWVALGFIIPIAFVIAGRNIIFCYYRKIILILCVMGVGGFVGLQSYKIEVGEELYVGRVNNIVTTDRFASGRLVIWENTLNLIFQRPVLGYGLDTSYDLKIEQAEAEGETVHHVHNVVLEILLETGFMGLIAFICFFVVLLKKFLFAYVRSKNLQTKAVAMSIFLSCIAYGICSMSLTSIFHAWWFLYLVVLIILLKISELKLRK